VGKNIAKIFCSRCVMDTDIPEIEFDINGECNYCKLYDELDFEYPINNERSERILNDLISKIKKDGVNKEYDSIVGLSGGTDSCYTLYKAKELGLRPLAVHFDNGWNSETAVNNIKIVTKALNVDLYTYVVDWEEFKDLQLSFLKAAVPDVELPTDWGIHGCLYKVATENNVRYILTGITFRAEGNMPSGWAYADGKYIQSVQKTFGKKSLKTFPQMTLNRMLYYLFIKKIKLIRFLNYFDYSKQEAKNILGRELGWIDYGGHHYESVFTRFYQSYISPVKYKMERRKVSLSAQVRSGHITREEALEILKNNSYIDKLLKDDKIYIAKKFGLKLQELDDILNLRNRSFKDFKTYFPLFRKLRYFIKIASKLKIIPVFYHMNKYNI